MSPDPADWLAAVAVATLPPPASAAPHEPVLVPAGFERRLLALFVDGLLVVFPGGILALVITFVGWGAVFGTTDFDGPPRDSALGDWLLMATWGAVALTYTSVEVFGRPTVGKLAAGLRLVVPAGNRRRRLWGRWALAYLPLGVYTLIHAVGAAHTAALDWEGFEERGVWPDERLHGVGLALAVLWLEGFAWAAGPRKLTRAERRSGTEVLRRLPRPRMRGRGSRSCQSVKRPSSLFLRERAGVRGFSIRGLGFTPGRI